MTDTILIICIVSLGLGIVAQAAALGRTAARRDRMLERLLAEAIAHVNHELTLKRHDLALSRLDRLPPPAIASHPAPRAERRAEEGVTVNFTGPDPNG